MSNYCDGSFYQQNLYTNTYSLWENSAYYDINNLSPQNFSSSWHRGNDEDFETRYTSGPMVAQASEPPDLRNRRVVERTSLYEYPDSFYKDVTANTFPPPTTKCTATNQQDYVVESKQVCSSTCSNNKMLRTNNIQQKFDKILTKPVKMSKAASMMQRMGWHDGALGRSGSGVLEPLASNAVYATQHKGYGQNFVKMEKEDRFSMNVLYQIYEFVKNNAEVELLFDRTLSKDERKQIHNIVDFMLNVDSMSVVEFESTAQMDMVLQICDVNCYILQTQSEGADLERQICIYKEAPEHVFLIIPDDLREERPGVNPPPEQPDSKEELSDPELEEETNPFLRSIIRNLKKTKEVAKVKEVQPAKVPKETSVLEKVLEYFAEFAEKRQYSQFKFLGPFTDEEMDGVHEFFEKAVQYLNNEPCDIKEAFAKISFEIGADITGNIVINKWPK